MINTNKRSYRRRNNSKVCNHCENTGFMIETCHRKYSFLPQFKFKN